MDFASQTRPLSGGAVGWIGRALRRVCRPRDFRASSSWVGKSQRRVVRALQEACLGRDLAVCGPSGISGGSVASEAVEAYVFIEAPGVYQVEMWTHRGADAYRIVQFAGLDAAVRCAIDAVEGVGPNSADRTTWSQTA